MITARLAAAAVVGALALASASLAAGPSTASAVFRVRADLRMCPSPRCGGYWVSRVNRATTTCADGTTRPWCYVAGIDHLTFVPAQAKGTDRNAGFLLRGRIVRGSGESWSLGRLIATDKWIEKMTWAEISAAHHLPTYVCKRRLSMARRYAQEIYENEGM